MLAFTLLAGAAGVLRPPGLLEENTEKPNEKDWHPLCDAAPTTTLPRVKM
jgi:hypothetical protein